MRNLFGFLTAAVLLIALGAVQAGASARERKLDLKEVPEAVLKAAESAVEGIEFKEVELGTKLRHKIYEFEGRVGKKKYDVEVKVDRDGEIVRVEAKEDDDRD